MTAPEQTVYWDFTSTCHVCGVTEEYREGQRVDTNCQHVKGQVYDEGE